MKKKALDITGIIFKVGGGSIGWDLATRKCHNTDAMPIFILKGVVGAAIGYVISSKTWKSTIRPGIENFMEKE